MRYGTPLALLTAKVYIGIMPKDRAAVKLGRKGGKARAAKLTADRRQEIAKRAAAARWAKRKGTP